MGISRSFKGKTIVLSFIAFAFLLPIALPAISVSATSTCSAAGNTTLTAYIVVSASDTTISGKTINAAGCDIGIYVSPGLNHILIKDNTVTGANQHGILVQDDSYVTISGNLVFGNGVATLACPPTGSVPGCIPENKPIQLVGTRNSLVTRNVVSYNTADGGIGIADDGAQNPGAPLGVGGSARTAFNDVVSWNTIVDNTVGCGIVIAAYNTGLGVNLVTASHNTIIGSSPAEVASGAPVYIGQIVVATDGPYAKINNVNLLANSIVGSFLPGIVLHANVFGDRISNTKISGNTLAENGWYPGPPSSTSNTPTSLQGSTGISIVAENPPPPTMPAAAISYTSVSRNTVLGDAIGLWLCYTTHTTVTKLMGNSATPQTTCAAGGS